MPRLAMRGAMAALAFGFAAAAPIVRGEQSYTTPGSYSWLCPAGVTSISGVAIGGGRYGGGGLGYLNSYTVVPGNSYTVVVGVGGTGGVLGGDSYFVNTSTLKGGGADNAGGSYTGTGGGNGGNSGAGGAGAGGYSGSGGTGGNAGAGGGGGGGGNTVPTGGGGGVGLLGQGSNGAAGTGSNGGGGGSGGATGTAGQTVGTCCGCVNLGGSGGLYGGGGGRTGNTVFGLGGAGAVRLVWPGTTRLFPSTDVGTP